MDGRLLATSGPDGTRFTLELPGPSRAGRARLHWESVTTRAALASAVVIALVAGIAGGALALALRRRRRRAHDRHDRRPQRRWRRRRHGGGFDPVALYAGSRNGVVTIEATFGVDDQTAGSGFVVERAARPDRHRLARRHAGAKPAAAATQATAVYIVLDDGTRADAHVLGYDLFEDTALLQVDPEHLGLRALPARAARARCAWATRSP